jgi:hypothetical protein
MKKLITILFIFCIFSVKAQTDTTHKDSVVRIYTITINEDELKGLATLINEADEKPSVIKEWLNFLQSRLQLVPPPNKEQPKK